MKVLFIGAQERFETYRPKEGELGAFAASCEKRYLRRGTDARQIAEAGQGAAAIVADPMTAVPGEAIRALPELRLIQSEGVGINGFDRPAADETGVMICNCKGVNAGAVAEQNILLSLMLLRRGICADAAVRRGGQMPMKEAMMLGGITELSQCRVGLLGFGDIARATARRLAPFGCEVSYWNRTRRGEEEERDYGVQYREKEELIGMSDIVMLCLAVTPETAGMVDHDFLAAMKPGAFLINTARGDLVDNAALQDALENGTLGGAGLDTLFPEPVLADHPLLHMAPAAMEKVIFSPHIGGITVGSFTRAHRLIWENLWRLSRGERPLYVTNG